MYCQKRLSRLREKLIDSGLEGILITRQENIFYLTGIEGLEGVFLVYSDGAVLFTDFRYLDAVKETKPFFNVIQCKTSSLKEIADWTTKKRLKKIGFESTHITVSAHIRYKEAFTHSTLIPCEGYIEQLRLIKDEKEQEMIRQSAQIASKAIDQVPEMLKGTNSLTEKELADELDYLIKKLGAHKPAFDFIVAVDEHSALPHTHPTDRLIDKKGLLLVDCGAVYKGYHSDITRVLSLDERPHKKRTGLFNLVCHAQKAAMQKVRPGVPAKEVDRAARTLIDDAGFKDSFGHSTGHGVGLMVHEEPRISQKSETILQQGMVFTIEPGIYLHREFGLRWEDTILVTRDGFRPLTVTQWDSLI